MANRPIMAAETSGFKAQNSPAAPSRKPVVLLPRPARNEWGEGLH